jgi:hypothetical protein
MVRDLSRHTNISHHHVTRDTIPIASSRQNIAHDIRRPALLRDTHRIPVFVKHLRGILLRHAG